MVNIIITDDIERENLIAEIWYGDRMIAEVNSKKEELEVVFYEIKGITMTLNQLNEVIQLIKDKLS